MNDYVIFTDSCCDLSQKLIKETGVKIIPLSYHMDGVSTAYTLENSEKELKEFYDSIRKGSMPTTSQITPTIVVDAFTPYLQQGFDVLYIAFSSGLSGSYASACMGANELKESFPDRKVVVVDSLCASMGQGLLVWHAANKKKNGMNIDTLADWVTTNRKHLCHWITVDDLNHLKRGGRVSAAAALVGSALSIKPVLIVDDEGHLVPTKKVRGRKQSLNTLVEMLSTYAIEPSAQTIFISHCDALEDAKLVEKVIKDTYRTKNIYINFIGPVIGSHSGPGTVALFFMGTQR